MHAEDDTVTAREVAVHPLDLIGVDVRCRYLDRCRQIENHLVLWRRSPGGSHRVADFEGKIELGGSEGFRAVFQHPFGLRLCVGEFPDQVYGGDCHVHDLGLAQRKDMLPERLRGGIVDMHDCPPRSFERFDAATDQVLASLREHLDADIVGNMAAFDQLANEVEIGL